MKWSWATSNWSCEPTFQNHPEFWKYLQGAIQRKWTALWKCEVAQLHPTKVDNYKFKNHTTGFLNSRTATKIQKIQVLGSNSKNGNVFLPATTACCQNEFRNWTNCDPKAKFWFFVCLFPTKHFCWLNICEKHLIFENDIFRKCLPLSMMQCDPISRCEKYIYFLWSIVVWKNLFENSTKMLVWSQVFINWFIVI